MPSLSLHQNMCVIHVHFVKQSGYNGLTSRKYHDYFMYSKLLQMYNHT